MVVGHDSQHDNSEGAPAEALRPGDRLLHGQYRIDKYLNAGGFGITYLALDSLDRKVVIKECFPNSMCCRSNGLVRARSSSHQTEFQSVVRNFGQEALRMAKLKHPNIVGVHQVFEDNCTAYMALDFVQGRDFLEIIEVDRERLNPTEIKRILLQLLDAVAYIHARDVLHRDISPDNILLDTSGNPVLIDFGAAREVATRASRALSALHIVKDGYSPQEFYIASGVQSASSDLYSLAATFHHLITGVAPPNSQVRLAALAADEADPYVPIPPRTEGYDHFFLGAIDKALAVFPKHRMQSATEWIEEIDQEERQKAMVKKAKQDEAIELSIRQLTAETNEALLAGGEADKEPKAAPAETAAPNTAARQAASSDAKKPEAPNSSKAAASAAGHAATGQVVAKTANARQAKNHSATSAPSPGAKARRTGQRRRKRSLFTRIVSVPIWLFTGGKQSGQSKTGGFEQ